MTFHLRKEMPVAQTSTNRQSFLLGAVFMAGLMYATLGLHWFITPASADATSLRTFGVVAQIVVAAIVAGWAWWKSRRSTSAPEPATST
jgi:hypothetical protein